MKSFFRAPLLLLFVFCTAHAGEQAPQFSVWGTRGPDLPPLQAGWTEVRAEPNLRELPTLSEKDSSAGFVLFQRHTFDEIYYDTIPAPSETNVKLQKFAAQGQYEPLTFALHALNDLKDCAVRVGELKSVEGGFLPANHIDVRWVRSVRHQVHYNDAKDKRYRLVPFYLEQHEKVDVRKGTTAQVWITIKVPEAAMPGDYTGSVKVQAAGRGAVEIPILLRVLPLRLSQLNAEITMSYQAMGNDLVAREKEWIDLREHGINAIEAGAGAVVASRDQNFGDDDVALTRRMCRENVELRRKVFGAQSDKWPINIDVGMQVLYFWDRGKNWFEFWPRSEKLESDFFKAITVTEEAVKSAGNPPLRLFVMDEPGGHPEVLKETVYYNKLARQKFPNMQTFCTIGGGIAQGIDEIGQLGPHIDLLTTNRFTPDLLQQLLARKKPYGIYNGGSSSEAIGPFVRDRYFFGAYFWKSGASEILQWVYAFSNPWTEPIRGNHGYVYRAADGPLPSIAFESIRAGIDDYRYHDLLWRLISVARTGGDAKALEAAKTAEAAAREVMRSIDFNFQAKSGAATPPPSAATMDKWRWKVASACLELLKHVPLEKALAGNIKRPGPLDFEFPEDGSSAKYGPELFPDSSFENGAGPWRAANGGDKQKGSGAIDSSGGYNSKTSFKLNNIDDAKGTDVATCVWGWFGGAPSMALTAGKTYEFSARMKCSGATPQLRISLPQPAAHESGGESLADANGWRRVWNRVTLKTECKPKYFAVWLQGPGTAWCDDLSFREVELPPITLSVSETEVDGSDHGVVVRVRQNGGSAPLNVRLTLPGVNREKRELSIPPGEARATTFDAAPLEFGKHEIHVEVMEGTVFSSVLPIQRVRGPFDMAQ